ncbi:MAG: ACS family MFS transporter [Gemmatimonadetes bacterium]|nr:ACS family MFS transporter [Gemmatimonadota bacterium]MBI3567967.1 ACS family MFS transporter [Gemmatimonadota bacterium]
MTVRATRWPAWYTVVLLCFAAVFISYIDRTNISVASIAMQGEFGWTETTKGIVLSSFFVGYLLLQVVSGTLAARYGGRIVLGTAVIWWSLWTMLTPRAAYLSLGMLIAARVALGLGEAAVFPACVNMVGRWVPVESRSRAVALFMSGLSLGTVFALPVSGWLVHAYGWPMPFYAFGLVGLAWAVTWFWRVAEGRGVPEEPSASPGHVPWRRLLGAPPVWAIVVAHFCTNWSLYVLLAWLPSYFKSTFGVSIANAGLLSAAPSLATFVLANAAGTIADRMMRRGRSATVVRKIMQSIGSFGIATFLLLLPLAGSATTGMFLMCAAAGALGFTLAGFAPNCFDIAPRHASVIWGISNTFATIPGIVGVAVTGWLVQRTGGYTAPFVVTASIAIVGGVVFLIAGSGERTID